MTAGRWKRICEIFEGAQDLPGSERAAWIAAQAGGDEQLRDAVQRMIEGQPDGEDFLEQPALAFSSTQLGPWRTLREIGRGGMGIVFLGERADGLYRQQVAIKVAPGGVHMETALLARLEHPSIARLIDAGATPEGFPYLVMEFVEGVPLDEWARRDNPSVRQRLDVFREICAAVRHAHQNLVLHRDLKPSNVLVTAGGRPKLLDFGIAKPLDLAATVTRFPAATPEFASPEQLLGEPLTTTSDVYALGLLLHALLTGRTPRSLAGGSLRGLVERISRGEPLPIAVEGDLGQVIRKATAQDPADRYGGAGELAEEIRRYQSGLPIEARPPSFVYRARRFAARNKGKLAVAALVTLALTGATTLALLQSRTADRRFRQVRRLATSVLYDIHDSIAQLPGSNPARLLLSQRALEYLEALSSEAGSDNDIWRDVASGYLRLGDVQGGAAVRNLGQYGEAAESFAKAKQIADRLIASNPTDPAARSLQLNAERPVIQARLRGADRKEALDQSRRHLEQAERFARDFPGDPRSARLVAEAHFLLASGLLYNARPEEALPQWLHTLELFEPLPRTEYLHHRKVAGIHQYLCDEYLRRKDTASARRHIEQAVALQEEALRLYPRWITARMDLSLCHYQSASLLQAEGRHPEAIVVWDRVIAARDRLVREEPTDVVGRAWLAGAHGHRGQSLEQLGRLAEAAAALESSLTQYLALLDVEKSSHRYQVAVAETEAQLADVYARLGKRADACRHYAGAARRFDGLSQEAKAASRNPRAAEVVNQALRGCPE
ncbi:MAG: protein kinase [Bryobacteraceae bacterium]